MSDYIKREAISEIIAAQCGECADICWEFDGFMPDCNSWCALGIAAKSINELPAADVRPVVLCKDCRHRDPEDHKCDCGQLERAGCVFPVDDDYFCAYGEM